MSRRQICPPFILWILLVVLSSSECHATSPLTEPVTCEREIARAAARYAIPLAVFYAVGLNETGWKGRLQPYSMNIDGRAVASASLNEALARFARAKATGARMIDVGCMQINHHYHAAHFASLEDMFDPAQNIDYAARFLRELKDRERTWTMAVARYNAGPDNDPAQKRYVCGVMSKMVSSGFGAWTESARKFCFSQPVANASQ
jgi:soluble lytic murein transglycosylase-like protein